MREKSKKTKEAGEKKRKAFNDAVKEKSEKSGIKAKILWTKAELEAACREVGAAYVAKEYKDAKGHVIPATADITEAFTNGVDTAYFYVPKFFKGRENDIDAVLERVGQVFNHEVFSHIGLKRMMDNYAKTHPGSDNFNQFCAKVFDSMPREAQEEMLAYMWDNNLNEDQRRKLLSGEYENKGEHDEEKRWDWLSDAAKRKVLENDEKNLRNLKSRAAKDRAKADALDAAAKIYSDKNTSNEATSRRKAAKDAAETADASQAKADKYATLKMGAADEYCAHLAERELNDKLEEKDKSIWQKFVDAVKKFFGIKSDGITDRDIAEALMQSKKQMEEEAKAKAEEKERKETERESGAKTGKSTKKAEEKKSETKKEDPTDEQIRAANKGLRKSVDEGAGSIRFSNDDNNDLNKKVEAARQDVDTNPTEAQKKAGNYKKGHVKIAGYDISIENPVGSVRSGVDQDGKEWETTMQNDYGQILGLKGADGDNLDVFLARNLDGWNGLHVYIVDQYNPDGTFDEHKVMFGFNDWRLAKRSYFQNYEEGWGKGRKIKVRAASMDEFKAWIDSDSGNEPFAKYKEENGGTLQLPNGRSLDIKDDRITGLAPNGIKSHIFELGGEELQKYLDSDEFKEWFGPWKYSSFAKYLLGNDYVSKLTGEEFPKEETKTKLRNKIAQFYEENYGGIVYRDELGKVALSKASVKKSMSHILDENGKPVTKNLRQLFAAFTAVPEIIKHGRILDAQQDWENKGYTSLTIGAPIKIGDQVFIGAVIVHTTGEDGFVFYLHKVERAEDILALDVNGGQENDNGKEKTSSKGESLTAADADSQGGSTTKLLNKILNAKNISSKVIDKNDEPLVTRKANINSDAPSGIFTADESGSAKGASFVKIVNPFTVDANGATLDKLIVDGKRTSLADLIAQAKQDGHDGIFITNAKVGDNTETTMAYIPFTDEQVLDIPDNLDNGSNGPVMHSVAEDRASYSDGKGNSIEDVTPKEMENSNVRFCAVTSDGGKKTMAIMHNTTEGQFEESIKLGGFPNISAAVVDLAKNNHTHFGELSFIIDPEKAERELETNPNTRLWSEDAFTPTVSPAKYHVQMKKFYREIQSRLKSDKDVNSELLRKVPQKMRGEVISGLANLTAGTDSYQIHNDPRLKFLWICDHGRLDKMFENDAKHPKHIRDAVVALTGGRQFEDLNDQEKEKFKEWFIRDYYGGKERYSEAMGESKLPEEYWMGLTIHNVLKDARDMENPLDRHPAVLLEEARNYYPGFGYDDWLGQMKRRTESLILSDGLRASDMQVPPEEISEEMNNMDESHNPDAKQFNSLAEAKENRDLLDQCYLFELKYGRVLRLSDLAGVVVTNKTSKEVIDAIMDAGLPFISYEVDNEEDRMRATLYLTKQLNARFSVVNSKADAMGNAERLGTSLSPAEVASVSSGDAASKLAIKKATMGGQMPKMSPQDELKFYLDAYRDAPDEVKKAVFEQAKARDFDIPRAMAEKIATMAENSTVFNTKLTDAEQKVLDSAVSAIADKLGIDEDQAKYVLWNHVNNGNDMVTNGMRTVMQGRCNLNTRESEELATETKQVRFRTVTDEASDSALEIYNRSFTVGGAFREQIQDEYRALESLVNAIGTTSGRAAASWENPMMRFNQLSSKNMADVGNYMRDYLEPLWDTVSRIVRSKNIKQEDLIEYMSLKHGLERNEVFARRDAEKAFAAYKAEHPNTKKTVETFYNDYRKKDYSGLTSWIKDKEINEDTLAAREEVAHTKVDNYEKLLGDDVKKLWDTANRATKRTLTIELNKGLISRATYDRVNAMFQYYIPLQGFADDTNEDMYVYDNPQHRGNATIKKNAKGRTSMAEGPLGIIAAQAQKAITAGNRNTAKRAGFILTILSVSIWETAM